MKKYLSAISLLLFLATVHAQEKLDIGLQLDLVVHNPDALDLTNSSYWDYSNFHTLRARFSAVGTVSANISLYGQVISDNASALFYLYSAYARLTPSFAPNLAVNVGLIPIPLGSFGNRNYSDKNPVIGVPLIYNYFMDLNPVEPQVSNSEILANRGMGNYLGSYYGYDVRGVPVIYESYWNTGINIYGSVKSLDYSLAALSGALSHPYIQVQDRRPNFAAQLAARPVTGLKLGAFGSYGPYLGNSVEEDLLPGQELNDFNQILFGFLAEFERGPFETHNEIVFNSFQHPFLGYLKNNGFYVEAKYKIIAGLYAAVRYEQMNFGKIEDETAPGSSYTWDYNLRRIEAALGYYLERRVLLKLDTQLNRVADTSLLDDDLYALQLAITL